MICRGLQPKANKKGSGTEQAPKFAAKFTPSKLRTRCADANAFGGDPMTANKPITIQFLFPQGEPRGVRIADITTRIVQTMLVPGIKVPEAIIAGVREPS